MGIFEELHPSTAGRGPTAPGSDVGRGPYAHASRNVNAAGETRGYSLGLGGFHGQVDENPGTTVDGASANFNVGGWRGTDGKTNYGIEVDAQLLKMGMDPGVAGGPLGYDFGILDAGGGIYLNDSTLTIGGGAEGLGGAAQYGTSDKHSDSDNFVRGGLSAGPSLAGRVHYGDADGDGVREIGLGADIGPVSFDVKSEYLGQAWNWLTQ